MQQTHADLFLFVLTLRLYKQTDVKKKFEISRELPKCSTDT
jgi:hypothetical protein